MVLKPRKKKDEVKSEAEELVEEATEEEEQLEEVEESESEESTEQPSVVGYPVFLTQADKDKMLYENNQMLRSIIDLVQKEE